MPSAKFSFVFYEFAYTSAWIFLQHSFYGFGFYAFRREKERAKLEIDKANLEAIHLKTELALLKSQFNPHLLYNTLNHFYGKVFKLDENLAEHIIKLSDILRYSLDGQPDTKVDLDEEIAYLHSFIELHKMRFGEKAHIDFQIEGDPENHQILPLVLISFVENAFKHGDYSQANHPIQIQLTVSESELVFRVHNLKRTHLKASQRVLSTGLGQENARRRLELVCPGEYELAIDNQVDSYTTQLTLKSAPVSTQTVFSLS